MAISPDVLASTLKDLLPGYSETFTKWHPLLDAIVTGGNLSKKKLEGPSREFTVVTGGPGQVTHVQTGNEVINGGRKQLAVRGNEVAPRLIYAFDVPRKDMAEANGKQDLAKLIKTYPERALHDFYEMLSQQLAVGDGANGVGGFVTLNGGKYYNPDGIEDRSGILESTSSTSTRKVNGLTSAGTPGWQNQYAHTTGFSVDGVRKMREVYFKCQREGRVADGTVDMMFGDEVSFLNYMDSLQDHVRTGQIESTDGKNYGRQSIKFVDSDFYLEDSIDLTKFAATNASKDGCVYMLNSSSFEAFTLGSNASMEGKGFFDQGAPMRIPDLDAYRYELILYFGLHTVQRRANGIVTGTALS
jgi:hypothetical protein